MAGEENLFIGGLKIILNGTKKEKGLRGLGRNVQGLEGTLKLPVKDNKEAWDYFEKRKDKFEESINNYEGKYSKYFFEMLKDIEDREKCALCY